jgi:hypothetical protein
MEIQKTKKAWEKAIILVFLGIFLISSVYAADSPDFGFIPPIPDHFCGDVILYGQSASIGTEVDVYVAGSLDQTYNISETGKYDLYVTIGTYNDTINFVINGGIVGTSLRQGGETIILDLELLDSPAPSSPSGGDSGGGSGGGGGGSGGKSISTPTYITNEPGANDKKDNQTQENSAQPTRDNTDTGITGRIIADFLGSGKGITTIVIILALIVGVVMLIKFKAPKWRKS